MTLRSIRVKVISVIIAVLSLSVAVSIYITVTNQRTNLLDETRKNLTITGDILNSVIRNIMLSGEAPIATDRKSTRLNSSHIPLSRMPSSA